MSVALRATRLSPPPLRTGNPRWIRIGRELSRGIGFGIPFAPRPLAATLPGLVWTNLPEFPSVSSGFHPAQVLGGYPAAPAMFRSGNPLSLFPRAAVLFLSEDWLGGAGSLCEAEDKQHRRLSPFCFLGEFRCCPRRAAKTSRRRDTKAKGRGGRLQ